MKAKYSTQSGDLVKYGCTMSQLNQTICTKISFFRHLSLNKKYIIDINSTIMKHCTNISTNTKTDGQPKNRLMRTKTTYSAGTKLGILYHDHKKRVFTDNV